MSRDANGDYTAPSNTVAPAVEGTVIEPTDFNDFVDDVEAALSESNFTGASSGTDNRLVRADGTSGKKTQEAVAATLDDSDNLTGLGNLSLGGYIDVSEISTPANPAANTARFYAVDNGGTTEVHFVDSAGTDVNLSNLSGTVTSVNMTAPAAGVTFSGGPITSSGSITLALANDLAALEALSGTGFAKRTGADTWTTQTTVQALEDVSSTQGEILYRGASAWASLGVGSSGQVLQSGGAGADPSWVTVAGTGDVTAASTFGTDNVLIRSDGTAKGVQATGVSVDDSDNITGVNNITIADDIIHAGDTNNLISFGTDTQDFQTGGSSRLDISDSGIRLGGSGARVTSILDEDNFASDSATALATQQSTKAYVDSVAAVSNPNLCINGDFQINQRVFAGGALSAGDYGHDRWKAATGGANYSVSGFTVTLSSGEIEQVIETSTWGYANFASQSVTISVEDPSEDMTATFGSVSGTINSGAGQQSVTLTTGAGDTGNLSLKLKRTAAGSVTFGRVKIELGSVATAWQARSSVREQALCFRYYQKSYAIGTAPGTATDANQLRHRDIASGALKDSMKYPFSVEMRTTPTVVWYSPDSGASGKIYHNNDSTDETVSSTNGAGTKISGSPLLSVTNGGSNENWSGHMTADAEL